MFKSNSNKNCGKPNPPKIPFQILETQKTGKVNKFLVFQIVTQEEEITKLYQQQKKVLYLLKPDIKLLSTEQKNRLHKFARNKL